MILIRLKRRSSKKNLIYTIVVTSNTFTPKGNQFIEKIGYYKPTVDFWSNKYLFVDFDRLQYWVARGARVNVSLFVLMRAWFSFKKFSSWKHEMHEGSSHFYVAASNSTKK